MSHPPCLQMPIASEFKQRFLVKDIRIDDDGAAGQQESLVLVLTISLHVAFDTSAIRITQAVIASRLIVTSVTIDRLDLF